MDDLYSYRGSGGLVLGEVMKDELAIGINSQVQAVQQYYNCKN